MFYFTVGPSHMHPAVPDALKRALDIGILSLSHRSNEFAALYKDTQSKLRTLLKIPSGHRIFFLSSANEVWERIIQNTVATTSAHHATDAFGKRFFEIAKELGKKALTMNTGENIHDLSHLSIPDGVQVACFTHNESSTGAMLDLDQLHTLKKSYSDTLFALDAVSSLPYPDIDYSLIDMVYASVQKGFGLPAGLAILIVSPQAMQASAHIHKTSSIGSYHSFQTLASFDDKGQTPETPNVLAIYLLREVLTQMLRETIQTIRAQTVEKAQLLYDCFEAHPKLSCAISETKCRSLTTPIAQVKGGNAELLQYLIDHGYAVGEGYGAAKNTHIRIANFPQHSLDMVTRLIAILNDFT
jgi:phosphoserine aminotransferase